MSGNMAANSFVTTLMQGTKMFFNLGYSDTDIYKQAQICCYENAFDVPCRPLVRTIPVNNVSVCGNINWDPAPRVRAGVGYTGTFVGGSTPQSRSLQVLGAMTFNYETAKKSCVPLT
jgi:hypothetical protein